ncbi:hypothetical protein C0585_03340 [Candidatus Woesearchaeota archaeon]|nr:MAG: hypothetical protein C0585_03340 [Candidatus Woesearchaeota archaeon]
MYEANDYLDSMGVCLFSLYSTAYDNNLKNVGCGACESENPQNRCYLYQKIKSNIKLLNLEPKEGLEWIIKKQEAA